MSTQPSYVEEAFINAFKAVNYWDMRLIQLRAIQKELRSNQRNQDASDTLACAILEEINYAYRSFFMLANLGDDAMREKARQIALDRILTEDDLIIAYLNPLLKCPSSYECEEEDLFRAELAEIRAKLRS